MLRQCALRNTDHLSPRRYAFHASHLVAHRLNLVPQLLGLGVDLGRLSAVGALQRCKVVLDALLDLLLALVYLA
jgi:hypothetical protein